MPDRLLLVGPRSNASPWRFADHTCGSGRRCSDTSVGHLDRTGGARRDRHGQPAGYRHVARAGIDTNIVNATTDGAPVTRCLCSHRASNAVDVLWPGKRAIQMPEQGVRPLHLCAGFVVIA